MTSDLQRAWEGLNKKRRRYDTLWSYYDGDQPVVYTNARLLEIFRDLDAVFTENWCSVVVNSALERIELKQLTTPDEEDQATLDDVWATNVLNVESDDVHLASLITGEAFLIIWRDGDDPIESYYNDPRLCYVSYDPERPRQMRYAAKRWVDEETERTHVTLYYPDRFEYYVSRAKLENEVIDPTRGWKMMEPAETPVLPNDRGRIPVFHFRTSLGLRSELDDVIPLQNGINKLLIDMMVAAEYGAFKQRWIISNVEIEGKLKNAPNEIWSIPAGDGLGQQTQVGQFDSSDLQIYLKAIDSLSTAAGIISRTPKHYFYAQQGTPSGEALIAMEAPLNKKCTRLIGRFSPTWQDVGSFLLELSGREVPSKEIAAVFEKPTTVQPLTSSQVRQFDVTTGIPLRTVLRREGWTDAELAQLESEREMEMQFQTTLGEQLLSSFEQGPGM